MSEYDWDDFLFCDICSVRGAYLIPDGDSKCELCLAEEHKEELANE